MPLTKEATESILFFVQGFIDFFFQVPPETESEVEEGSTFRFHLKRKVRLKREVLLSRKFVDRWLNGARIACMNRPTLKHAPVNQMDGRREEAFLRSCWC